MEEADMLSDEIAIMASGKIMVRGTPTVNIIPGYFLNQYNYF